MTWKAGRVFTAYHPRPYGELFDFATDPGEIRNLRDDRAAAALKARLLRDMLDADWEQEPLAMPRIAVA
ncbi:MAG: hypothetical protein AAB368_12370 [bacterium]